MLTDTHCHLFYDQIKTDLDSVLERAKTLGVNRFICVATNLDDANECLELSKKYESIGMLSFHVICFLHFGQYDLPETTPLFKGKR